MSLRRHVLSLANWLVIASLAICYVQLLRYFLAQSVPITMPYEPMTSLGKILVTGTVSILANLAIFAFNAFITRQNMNKVGIGCALSAFAWYYLINPGFDLAAMIYVILTTYSLFAMLAITATPIAVGYVLNKRHPFDGFISIFGSR